MKCGTLASLPPSSQLSTMTRRNKKDSVNMTLGSLEADLAFSNPSVGAVHAMSNSALL